MAEKDKKEKKPDVNPGLGGGEGPKQPMESVTFTPAQIDLINKMLGEQAKSLKDSLARPDSPNSAISLYNQRDPKEIKTVKVSRFDAMWVVGFKDLQNDPYKKTPKYLRYGIEPIRKLTNEPYVTLRLSADGKTFVEKELLLIDYMENRDTVNVPVKNIEMKEVIHDHGVLGQSGQFAVAIDDKGKPESRPTILAQSKSVERIFTVHLDGFDEDTTFITDFLG